MKITNPRALALAALNRFDRTLSPPSEFLSKGLQKGKGIEQRDRSLAFHLIQGVMRWRLRLDWILGLFLEKPITKLHPKVLNILRLALYQILFLDKIPHSAAVNEAVEQVKALGLKQLAGFINGVLRAIVRQAPSFPFPDKNHDPITYLSTYHSFPQWMTKIWVEQFGFEEAENLMAALNEIPRIVLRANTLKISREDLIEELAREGIEAKPTRYSPWGLEVVRAEVELDKSRSFKRGHFTIQGEPAQICSFLLSPFGKKPLLDLCAGMGGKSTHLAELTGNRVLIIALDTNPSRLLSLKKTARRLGAERISPLLFDATDHLEALFRERFERILLDSPCSGLGTISKNPDIKWSKSERDISRLALLQKELLLRGLENLAPGGRLLYVTCTMLRQENEEVVDWVLAKQREVSLIHLGESIAEWGKDLVDERGFFRSYPHKHHMEGFFAALIEKKR